MSYVKRQNFYLLAYDVGRTTYNITSITYLLSSTWFQIAC